MSRDKLNADIVNGIGDNSAPVIAPQPQPVSNTSAIQAFKNAGNAFTATSVFRVDEIKKVNGIWQVANYWLAGGQAGFDWTLNGIPWAILDNLTRGNAVNIQVGDMVKFDENNNSGTIDDYDNASNAVGIKYGNYGEIWFNADAFLKL